MGTEMGSFSFAQLYAKTPEKAIIAPCNLPMLS